MKIPKETLGLAAEFAVASEVCRRGIYAQLTLGLRKRTDLLIETETAMLRLQVKGKQQREWPGCKGIFGNDIILVFVDYENKRENERPDFYILTPKDWEELLEVQLRQTGKVERDYVCITQTNVPKTNVPIWKDGYEGMGVRSAMIQQYREQWDKIKRIVENV